ncbi:hypothetical protein [Streptomyces sp. NPDC005017]|uniref:hypothetical protein n=1 Tax=Streptomyces sp. NPDC005017 TaxID=3364706 RepID=UPI0036804382
MNSPHRPPHDDRPPRPLGRIGGVVLSYLLLAVTTALHPTLMSTRVVGQVSFGLVLVTLQVGVMVAALAVPARRAAAVEPEASRSRAHDPGPWS